MEGHVETGWMKGRKGADRFQPRASTKGKGEISTSNLDASRRALYATDISLQIVNFIGCSRSIRVRAWPGAPAHQPAADLQDASISVENGRTSWSP